MHAFKFNEKYLSQIPALQELIALGYAYISPERALALRGGKNSNVLLESVLREQLQKFNRIQYKGKEYHFSEANIQEAILESTHPATLTLTDFMDPFPRVWKLQRKQFGF